MCCGTAVLRYFILVLSRMDGAIHILATRAFWGDVESRIVLIVGVAISRNLSTSFGEPGSTPISVILKARGGIEEKVPSSWPVLEDAPRKHTHSSEGRTFR